MHIICTDIYRKICRESTDRTRKINKKMNKIHSPAFGGVGALRAPTVDFVHFFVDFPCVSVDIPAYLCTYLIYSDLYVDGTGGDG